MAKKIYKILALAFVTLLVPAGIFTSCNNDDDEDDGTIVLESFGPSPALRGGDLKFIGRNLDKVTAILLPDSVPGSGISSLSIESFTTKTPELLVLTIPEETDGGFVTLKTPQGDIITKTMLGISEPITIDTIYPAKARPGTVITVEGDYLNLIHEIIFTTKKSVIEFNSHSKNKIEVTVPADAQTGILTFSNGATEPILIEISDALEITIPVVTSISPNPVKAGAQLTISGTDLDLISSVVFGGSKTVQEFTSKNASELVLTVPANALDGKIKVIPASAVEVEYSELLKMVVPVISGITPNPAKTGSTLTVTGTDLDLITSITFGGGKTGTIQSGGSATQIMVDIPADAADGTVSFGTAAGTSVVSSETITFEKPAITSITPASTAAHGEITITGTNLDVVKTILFSGGYSADVTGATATQIVVPVTPGSISGPLSLVTTNGDTIVTTNSITVVPNIPESITVGDVIYVGTKVSITGTKLNLATQVIFPENIVATKFGIKSETLLEVYVPEDAKKGIGKIKFITDDNEIAYSPDVNIKALGVDPVKDAALVFFNFDDGDAGIGWNNYGGIKSDVSVAISGKYYYVDTAVTEGWNVYFARNWGKFSTAGIDAATDVMKMDINILGPVNSGLVLKFRQKSTDNDYWYVWKIGEMYPTGTKGWITFTIPLSAFRDSDGNGTGTITDASKLGSEYGLTAGWGTGNLNMCIDNVRFEHVTK